MAESPTCEQRLAAYQAQMQVHISQAVVTAAEREASLIATYEQRIRELQDRLAALESQ